MEGHETGQGGEGEEAECARQSWKSELETLGKGPRDRIIPVLGVGGRDLPNKSCTGHNPKEGALA